VNAGNALQVAILLYPGVTALDAVGPWEVLSRLAGAEVRFVGKEPRPLATEGGTLLLGATHAIAESSSPDVVVVPGGSTTPGQIGGRRCARLIAEGFSEPDAQISKHPALHAWAIARPSVGLRFA
jgi:putative intracellular protease/amidase